jgi:metal-sulfur cluster biosynthetic enzyme
MEGLREVIDPETGIDVLRLGLVRNIHVEHGDVSLTLRPASSICPVAYRLAILVRETVSSVPGVKALNMRVTNHAHAAELESLLNEDP